MGGCARSRCFAASHSTAWLCHQPLTARRLPRARGVTLETKCTDLRLTLKTTRLLNPGFTMAPLGHQTKCPPQAGCQFLLRCQTYAMARCPMASVCGSEWSPAVYIAAPIWSGPLQSQPVSEPIRA